MTEPDCENSTFPILQVSAPSSQDIFLLSRWPRVRHRHALRSQDPVFLGLFHGLIIQPALAIELSQQPLQIRVVAARRACRHKLLAALVAGPRLSQADGWGQSLRVAVTLCEEMNLRLARALVFLVVPGEKNQRHCFFMFVNFTGGCLFPLFRS